MNGSTVTFRRRAAALAAAILLPASVLAALPEVKISDAKMVQMPHFTFILPNSAIEMSVHQQVSSTTIDIFSKYDILDSFFNIGLDLRYNFAPYFAGFEFSDTINFEQSFGTTTYFLRVHDVTPYFGYNLTKNTEVKGGVTFENTTTASVDKTVDIDKGKNTLEFIGVRYSSVDPLNPAPNGSVLGAKAYGSFRDLDSDYDYTKGEVEAQHTISVSGRDYFEARLELKFPMTTGSRPFSDTYFMGGYEVLRGYSYREFYGTAVKYGRVNYHIPLMRPIKKEALRTSFEILTLDFEAESAQTGGIGGFGGMENFKNSLSLGGTVDIILFEHYNLKFDTFVGKALEPRSPVLYFILTAYTYFSA